MRWMTDVCETWSIDELAQLDEQAITRVLRGWHDQTVPTYDEVLGGRRTWRWPHLRDYVAFALGATTTLAVGATVVHRFRR